MNTWLSLLHDAWYRKIIIVAHDTVRFRHCREQTLGKRDINVQEEESDVFRIWIKRVWLSIAISPPKIIFLLT